MRVPHTIPKVILRAYTRTLNEDQLKKSYEGRTLISEDPTWDKDVTPTLAQQCLDLVQDEFLFYHHLLEYFNNKKLEEYEFRRDNWEKSLAEYVEKRALYEKRLIAYQSRLDGYGDTGDFDDLLDDTVDDTEQPTVDANGRPLEPEKIDDEFAQYEPIPSILDTLKDEDRVFIIEELELDLVPLPLAIKIIPDEYYWERLARDRWQVFDINDHNKSWRRMYMEKSAWDAIEKFHPADDDFDKLKEEIELVCAEVIRLNIQNVIPICFGTPAKEVKVQTFEGDNEWGPDEEFDVGFGDNEMFNDPDDEGVAISEETYKSLTNKKKKKPNKNDPPRSTLEADYIRPVEKRNPEMDRQDPSHLDFSLILPLFTNLKEMTIVYEMVETGLDWEERYFKFTDKDCLNIAKALAETPTVEKFELLRSHMSGEQCKTLVREGLIKMPHLKYLNLNYNRIGDIGARAVARLLIDEESRAPHTLHTVRVARNRIHNTGGKALAYALTKNNHLAVLDARLNSFKDSAGSDFGHALVKNTRLLAISLSANKFTLETAYVLGKMLFHNRTIRELDISSNDLGKKGGEFLALGMRNNKTILRLDVRCCNIGLDFVYDVSTQLRKNRNRISGFQSITESDDYYPPEEESRLLDIEEVEFADDSDDEQESEGGEDEEEMEDEEEEAGQGEITLSGTVLLPKVEIDTGGLTPEMLANAGLMDINQARAALKDPRIAAALAKAMRGAGDAKKVEAEGTSKSKGKKWNKEIKVVKGPQEMKTSNHAFPTGMCKCRDN